jgi:hypothetical protein
MVAKDGSTATNKDMMQKAMRHKAEKNLNTASMKKSATSSTDFSDSRISLNSSSVGFSLGGNPNDYSISANVLIHLEYDRLTVAPKISTVPETPIIEEEEVHGTTDGGGSWHHFLF